MGEWKGRRFEYRIIDELHVDVDGPDAGHEERHSDGRIEEQLAVEGPERVLGLCGVRELNEAPVLRSATF